MVRAVAISHVERCDQLSASADRDLTAIYDAAFARGGAPRRALMRCRVASGDCRLSIAQADGAAIGLALWAPLRRHPAAIVEYLAVDAGRRSRGVGGALLRGVAERAAADAVQGLLIEVARPGADADARRRVAFYERSGARPLAGIDGYAMPSLGDGPEVPMSLWWIPAACRRQPAPGMLRALVEDMLGVTYGLAPTHPAVVRNLAPLPESVV